MEAETKNNSAFRILEYNNHFRIEKQILEPCYILGIFLYSTYRWKTICKDGNVLNVHNCLENNHEFKSKKECLKWIKDYFKYPIYHYL